MTTRSRDPITTKDGLLVDPFASDVEKIQTEEKYIVKVLGNKADGGEGTGSKQLPKDHFEELTKNGLIIPPLYDPMVWSFLLEQNTRLKRLIEAMANNTVGLGWEIIPKTEEESYVEQHKDAIRAEREKYAELIENINPEMPFTEMTKQVKTDEEATGQAYFEIERNNKGDIAHLWHVPSHTVRVGTMTENRMRFVQMRTGDQTKKVWFKAWGEEHSLDAKTGKWDDEENVTEPANEILQMKLYTPRSSFYGVPRVVSAAPAIAGTRLAQRRNVAFFENDATPRMAIIVNGGELSEESMAMIEQFVDVRAKGPGNAGRTMILQAKADAMLGDGTNKVNIQVVPLTVGVQDDASFSKYTEQNNEEIREAFGISQIFIGTSDDVNRAVAIAAKQITVEQVFEPEAVRYEYRLTKILMPDAKHTKLRFRRTKTSDFVSEAQAYAMLGNTGGVTPNDIRQFLGKSPFKGVWAATPLAVLKAGMVEDSADETATVHTIYKDKMPPSDADMQDKQMTHEKEMQTETLTMQREQADKQIKLKSREMQVKRRAGAVSKTTPEIADFVAAYGDKGGDVFSEVQSIALGLRKMGLDVEITLPVFIGETEIDET